MELEQILLQTLTEKLDNLESTFQKFIKINLAGLQTDSVSKLLKECDLTFRRIEEDFSEMKIQIQIPPEMMEDFYIERLKLQEFIKEQEEAINKKQSFKIKSAIAISFLAFLLVWCISVNKKVNNKLDIQNANDLKYQYLQTSVLARNRYTNRLDSIYSAIGKDEFCKSLDVQKQQEVDIEQTESNHKK